MIMVKNVFSQDVQLTLFALFKSESVCEKHGATHAQPSTENVFQDVREIKGVQGNPSSVWSDTLSV